MGGMKQNHVDYVVGKSTMAKLCMYLDSLFCSKLSTNHQYKLMIWVVDSLETTSPIASSDHGKGGKEVKSWNHKGRRREDMGCHRSCGGWWDRRRWITESCSSGPQFPFFSHPGSYYFIYNKDSLPSFYYCQGKSYSQELWVDSNGLPQLLSFIIVVMMGLL